MRPIAVLRCSPQSRGNARGYPAGGVESFGSTLHWGPNWSMDRYTQTHATYTLPTGDFSDAFHVFGLYWNETRLQTYLDTVSDEVGCCVWWPCCPCAMVAG